MSKTAFLSSTGADLRAYREAAFLAIQKLDDTPLRGHWPRDSATFPKTNRLPQPSDSLREEETDSGILVHRGNTLRFWHQPGCPVPLGR